MGEPATFDEADWAELTGPDKKALGKFSRVSMGFDALAKAPGVGQKSMDSLMAKGLAIEGEPSIHGNRVDARQPDAGLSANLEPHRSVAPISGRAFVPRRHAARHDRRHDAVDTIEALALGRLAVAGRVRLDNDVAGLPAQQRVAVVLHAPLQHRPLESVSGWRHRF